MCEWIKRPHSCFCQIHVVCIVIKHCKNSHVPFAFSFCQPSGNNFWVVSKNFSLNIYEHYKLSQMPSGPVQFAYNVLCERKPLQFHFSVNLRCYSLLTNVTYLQWDALCKHKNFLSAVTIYGTTVKSWPAPAFICILQALLDFYRLYLDNNANISFKQGILFWSKFILFGV